MALKGLYLQSVTTVDDEEGEVEEDDEIFVPMEPLKAYYAKRGRADDDADS